MKNIENTDKKRLTLASLAPGESGHVYSVDAPDKRVRRHILDMGITPGTEVTFVKAAPMGDPIEVALRGYSLSLRRADAGSVTLMSADEHRLWHESAEPVRAGYEAEAAETLEAKAHLRDGDAAAHEQAARLTAFMLDAADCGEGGNCEKCDKRGKCPGAWPGEQPESKGRLRLALAGNPNCGKTTLFNAMTGAREYVGNWPGVTVEKKEGRVRDAAERDGLCTMGHEMTLIDLPGIYSLSPYSMEEMVARDYILNEKPDAIINIVDGTNLERNLYLTVQLLELEKPMIIALNMMDEVEKHGDSIDTKALSRALGIPVVAISARTGMGVDDLIRGAQKLLGAAHAQYHEGFKIEPDDVYDDYTHMQHHRIGLAVEAFAQKAGLPLHWAEIKLLEGDARVREQLALDGEAERAVDAVIAEYARANPLGDGESAVADSRYRYIERVCAGARTRGSKESGDGHSARIDAVITHKLFALPIFLLIMAGIFTLTFSSVGAFLSDAVALFIEGVCMPFVRGALEGAGAAAWFTSLITDGVIAGVGGVLTFLPQIAILFFCLSILEDSGYMSRIAFIMDKPMRKLGLSGKSFIPLLMGFGCTVPAVMGARTMDNERDRRMTVMLTPFMSCSAKLPVYGLIAGAFFGRGRTLVIFSLYLLGVLLGVLSGLIFKKRLFKGEEAPFVIELPPYRMPTAKNTFLHVWERVSHFLEKAGTIILSMSVLLWFLESFDMSLVMVDDPAVSIIGRLGSFIAPVFRPLGFGSWQATVALITGVIAKEAVVSSLSMFCGFSLAASDATVNAVLSGLFTPAAAYAFLVFVLLYVPCMAAVATMRRELGSAKWTLFAVAWQLIAAYGAAFVAFTLISLIGG